MKTCACCGHPLPSEAIADKLSPVQRRFYEIVRRAGQAGISGPDLRDVLYMHDIDGGPESASILSVVRAVINRKLARDGLEIVSTHRGPLSRYLLRAREP